MRILAFQQFFAALSSTDINIPHVTATSVLNNALNIFYFTAGTVAVIVIILAGFKYVTSVGKQDSIAKAKNAILYAVIGLIVIMLAFAITWFVIGRFQ
jgi:lysylphosphatidylglycerol synthetase-like protein (DUF2156 family)